MGLDRIFDAVKDLLTGDNNPQNGQPNVRPASEDPYGDPADEMGGGMAPAGFDQFGNGGDTFQGQDVLPASQDPYGDPADEFGGGQVLPASQDPYGDPADEEGGIFANVRPASEDPLGDPADDYRR